jgi:putative ABC transport system permease protein
MIYPDVDATVMIDYTSLRDSFLNESTNREETVIISPVDSEFAETVTSRLREYENTAIFGVGEDMDTYRAIVPREEISPDMLSAYFAPEELSENEYEMSTEILTLDSEHYAAFCEKAGVPVGSNILVNHYSYNDNGKMVALSPFLFERQDLHLIKADGSVREMPIHGVLTQKDIPNELLPPNKQAVRLIVPQGEMRGYTWYATPDDIDGFIDHANAIMSEEFSQGEEEIYMESGFDTRVYTIQDYMKVMNIGIGLATVFVYGFVALLTLIGLTNVISTISANVRMRAREFAVLQSVGMTYSGLKRMLNLESVMSTTKSLIIGLPIAIILTYLINLPIRATFPIPYQLPWRMSMLCIAIMFVITWVTMRYSISRLRDRNTVETIRSEHGT